MNSYRFQAGVRGRGLSPNRRFLYSLRAISESPILLLEIPAILGKRRTKRKLVVRFMNDLCNATLGKGLDVGNKFIARLRKRQTRAFDNKFKDRKVSPLMLSDSEIKKISHELKVDGFVRLPQFISSESAERLRTKIERSHGKDSAGVLYQNVLEWQRLSTQGRLDTVDSAVVQASLEETIDFSDLTLIARQYLGASPSLLGPHSWTITHRPDETDLQLEENAMAYHCDSDFFGFLKVFLLLTEVTMQNGPFTFIRGSHRGKRHVQGRVADQILDIQTNEEMFGTGKPGDVIIAATAGWHKATPPEEGTRTMVQWLYTNGLLGSISQ